MSREERAARRKIHMDNIRYEEGVHSLEIRESKEILLKMDKAKRNYSFNVKVVDFDIARSEIRIIVSDDDVDDVLDLLRGYE